MKYWWVNHKQTFTTEINEGYIWSPKHKSDGHPNHSYTNLTLTNLHDIVFSYGNGKILAIGKVENKYAETERPAEFGSAGNQWSDIGWMVPIQWFKLPTPFIPKEHINLIAPLLPSKYSPIQPNGNGNQGIYLAEIEPDLGELLRSLIAETNPSLELAIKSMDISIEENQVQEQILNTSKSPTEKSQLIKARVGQGLFRSRVEEIEKGCRVTNTENKLFLIASHIKPWKDASDEEKLDGHNGFLLSPHVDKLFDRGFISFEDNGSIIFANDGIVSIYLNWGLDQHKNVGKFKRKQKEYLQYHRNHLFNRHGGLLIL